MSFSNRIVTFAALVSAAAAIIGLGAPGSAKEISEAVNAPAAILVPALAMTPAPAPVTTPLSAPTTAQAVGLNPGETVAFGTLAAAVAAQPTTTALGKDDSGDVSCMASAIYFEAKGEPLSGQLAVAEVILNRMKSGRFPKSVCSVVTQPGQFSFVRGGRIPTVGGNQAYHTAVAVARVALSDAWDSPAADAMYFHARRVAPGWHRTHVATIGNHVFYR